jgi:transposase
MLNVEAELRGKYEAMFVSLNAAGRRRWAATEALALGRGGISVVSRATGLCRTTIYAGIAALEDPERIELEAAGRCRKPGGGRKRLVETDGGLAAALDRLVEPATRGDPMRPLRWTCKSTSKLAAQLTAEGHPVSARTVATLLREQGYSLQSVRKTREGKSHPDRDAQFRHLDGKVRRALKAGEPVISVDTKKKELVGDFHNKGRDWHPEGRPPEARVHDFEDKQLGKVAPCGVYDLAANEGWVSVGIDHDTAEFAVATIRRWWRNMGCRAYPGAARLLITADSGGSNGSRVKLWKYELQKLADELGMAIDVCHFPPGTSKWNKIEHRMFCHITSNWRGRPLESTEIIVKLIGATTTKEGLRIKAAIDKRSYAKGLAVTRQQMATVNIKPDRFHGEWNYRISPHRD